MPRSHDKDYFYKYVSSETAKLIITNQKLKWSCPADYNDPFEHLFSFFPDVKLEVFSQKLTDRLRECFYGDEEIEFDTSRQAGKVFSDFMRIRNKVPRSELDSLFDGMAEKLKESGKSAL
jgi:hypothetical protein